MEESTNSRELWVCWSEPPVLPDGPGWLVSFLPPSIEERVEQVHQGKVIRAREASRGVRAAARELYLNLVAAIGTVRCSSGLTLRQRLTPSGQASLWWYHPVSFKDCEGEPTFQSIIAVMTIRAVAEQCGVSKLILVGAPRESHHALCPLQQIKFELRLL